jgi:acyl carrier protein
VITPPELHPKTFELLFEFEDKFGIELPKELRAPKTIGELTGLIERLRATALGNQ